MSQTYPNYPSTSYPDSIDTFEKIVDVTLSTLPYAIMYQNYFEKGNLEEAYRILEEHPELELCLMNADKFNKLIDAIKAIETDHNSTKSKVTTVTNQASTNATNISKLNTNVSNISTNVSSLSSNVTNLSSSITTLNTKITTLENSGTTVTKSTIGLGNVDNTADKDKSVKYATSAGTCTGNATTSSSCTGNSATATYATSAGNCDTVDGYHITISTTNLTHGSSPLTTNTFCFVYE